MSNIQHTLERTADNGEIIKARLTQTANGYLIEILANGMAIIDETFEASDNEQRARGLAHIAATAYVFKLNNPNYGVIEESTDVLAAVETMIADLVTEPAAVDMGGDFEGFVEAVNAPTLTDKQVRGLRWLSAQNDGARYQDIKHDTGMNMQDIKALSKECMIEKTVDKLYQVNNWYAVTDAGRAYLDALDAPGLVSVEPTPAQESVWYTEPVTSADGEQLKARIMQLDTLTWIVDLFKEGVKVDGEGAKFSGRYIAVPEAGKMVASYLNKLNAIRAAEMGDETETIYPPLTDKEGRIAQLTAHIERLQRELRDYEFELFQLTDEDE